MTNRWLALDTLDPALARTVTDATLGARDWNARFHAIDEVLAARLLPRDARDGDAEWAWEELRQRDGHMNIGRLAAAAGRSPRHLIANFRARIGVTPKTAARLMRFNRVLRVHPVAALGAGAAADCGYADQSHMISEFGRFAGAPPGAIARRVAGFTLAG